MGRGRKSKHSNNQKRNPTSSEARANAPAEPEPEVATRPADEEEQNAHDQQEVGTVDVPSVVAAIANAADTSAATAVDDEATAHAVVCNGSNDNDDSGLPPLVVVPRVESAFTLSDENVSVGVSPLTAPYLSSHYPTPGGGRGGGGFTSFPSQPVLPSGFSRSNTDDLTDPLDDHHHHHHQHNTAHSSQQQKSLSMAVSNSSGNLESEVSRAAQPAVGGASEFLSGNASVATTVVSDVTAGTSAPASPLLMNAKSSAKSFRHIVPSSSTSAPPPPPPAPAAAKPSSIARSSNNNDEDGDGNGQPQPMPALISVGLTSDAALGPMLTSANSNTNTNSNNNTNGGAAAAEHHPPAHSRTASGHRLNNPNRPPCLDSNDLQRVSSGTAANDAAAAAVRHLHAQPSSAAVASPTANNTQRFGADTSNAAASPFNTHFLARDTILSLCADRAAAGTQRSGTTAAHPPPPANDNTVAGGSSHTTSHRNSTVSGANNTTNTSSGDNNSSPPHSVVVGGGATALLHSVKSPEAMTLEAFMVNLTMQDTRDNYATDGGSGSDECDETEDAEEVAAFKREVAERRRRESSQQQQQQTQGFAATGSESTTTTPAAAAAATPTRSTHSATASSSHHHHNTRTSADNDDDDDDESEDDGIFVPLEKRPTASPSMLIASLNAKNMAELLAREGGGGGGATPPSTSGGGGTNLQSLMMSARKNGPRSPHAGASGSRGATPPAPTTPVSASGLGGMNSCQSPTNESVERAVRATTAMGSHSGIGMGMMNVVGSSSTTHSPMTNGLVVHNGSGVLPFASPSAAFEPSSAAYATNAVGGGGLRSAAASATGIPAVSSNNGNDHDGDDDDVAIRRPLPVLATAVGEIDDGLGMMLHSSSDNSVVVRSDGEEDEDGSNNHHQLHHGGDGATPTTTASDTNPTMHTPSPDAPLLEVVPPHRNVSSVSNNNNNTNGAAVARWSPTTLLIVSAAIGATISALAIGVAAAMTTDGSTAERSSSSSASSSSTPLSKFLAALKGPEVRGALLKGSGMGIIAQSVAKAVITDGGRLLGQSSNAAALTANAADEKATQTKGGDVNAQSDLLGSPAVVLGSPLVTSLLARFGGGFRSQSATGRASTALSPTTFRVSPMSSPDLTASATINTGRNSQRNSSAVRRRPSTTSLRSGPVTVNNSALPLSVRPPTHGPSSSAALNAANGPLRYNNAATSTTTTLTATSSPMSPKEGRREIFRAMAAARGGGVGGNTDASVPFAVNSGETSLREDVADDNGSPITANTSYAMSNITGGSYFHPHSHHAAANNAGNNGGNILSVLSPITSDTGSGSVLSHITGPMAQNSLRIRSQSANVGLHTNHLGGNDVMTVPGSPMGLPIGAQNDAGGDRHQQQQQTRGGHDDAQGMRSNNNSGGGDEEVENGSFPSLRHSQRPSRQQRNRAESGRSVGSGLGSSISNGLIIGGVMSSSGSPHENVVVMTRGPNGEMIKVRAPHHHHHQAAAHHAHSQLQSHDSSSAAGSPNYHQFHGLRQNSVANTTDTDGSPTHHAQQHNFNSNTMMGSANRHRAAATAGSAFDSSSTTTTAQQQHHQALQHQRSQSGGFLSARSNHNAAHNYTPRDGPRTRLRSASVASSVQNNVAYSPAQILDSSKDASPNSNSNNGGGGAGAVSPSPNGKYSSNVFGATVQSVEGSPYSPSPNYNRPAHHLRHGSISAGAGGGIYGHQSASASPIGQQQQQQQQQQQAYQHHRSASLPLNNNGGNTTHRASSVAGSSIPATGAGAGMAIAAGALQNGGGQVDADRLLSTIALTNNSSMSYRMVLQRKREMILEQQQYQQQALRAGGGGAQQQDLTLRAAEEVFAGTTLFPAAHLQSCGSSPNQTPRASARVQASGGGLNSTVVSPRIGATNSSLHILQHANSTLLTANGSGVVHSPHTSSLVAPPPPPTGRGGAARVPIPLTSTSCGGFDHPASAPAAVANASFGSAMMAYNNHHSSMLAPSSNNASPRGPSLGAAAAPPLGANERLITIFSKPIDAASNSNNAGALAATSSSPHHNQHTTAAGADGSIVSASVSGFASARRTTPYHGPVLMGGSIPNPNGGSSNALRERASSSARLGSSAVLGGSAHHVHSAAGSSPHHHPSSGVHSHNNSTHRGLALTAAGGVVAIEGIPTTTDANGNATGLHGDTSSSAQNSSRVPSRQHTQVPVTRLSSSGGPSPKNGSFADNGSFGGPSTRLHASARFAAAAALAGRSASPLSHHTNNQSLVDSANNTLTTTPSFGPAGLPLRSQSTHRAGGGGAAAPSSGHMSPLHGSQVLSAGAAAAGSGSVHQHPLPLVRTSQPSSRYSSSARLRGQSGALNVGGAYSNNGGVGVGGGQLHSNNSSLLLLLSRKTMSNVSDTVNNNNASGCGGGGANTAASSAAAVIGRASSALAAMYPSVSVSHEPSVNGTNPPSLNATTTNSTTTATGDTQRSGRHRSGAGGYFRQTGFCGTGSGTSLDEADRTVTSNSNLLVATNSAFGDTVRSEHYFATQTVAGRRTCTPPTSTSSPLSPHRSMSSQRYHHHHSSTQQQQHRVAVPTTPKNSSQRSDQQQLRFGGGGHLSSNPSSSCRSSPGGKQKHSPLNVKFETSAVKKRKQRGTSSSGGSGGDDEEEDSSSSSSSSDDSSSSSSSNSEDGLLRIMDGGVLPRLSTTLAGSSFATRPRRVSTGGLGIGAAGGIAHSSSPPNASGPLSVVTNNSMSSPMYVDTSADAARGSASPHAHSQSHFGGSSVVLANGSGTFGGSSMSFGGGGGGTNNNGGGNAAADRLKQRRGSGALNSTVSAEHFRRNWNEQQSLARRMSVSLLPSAALAGTATFANNFANMNGGGRLSGTYAPALQQSSSTTRDADPSPCNSNGEAASPISIHGANGAITPPANTKLMGGGAAANSSLTVGRPRRNSISGFGFGVLRDGGSPSASTSVTPRNNAAAVAAGGGGTCPLPMSNPNNSPRRGSGGLNVAPAANSGSATSSRRHTISGEIGHPMLSAGANRRESFSAAAAAAAGGPPLAPPRSSSQQVGGAATDNFDTTSQTNGNNNNNVDGDCADDIVGGGGAAPNAETLMPQLNATSIGVPRGRVTINAISPTVRKGKKKDKRSKKGRRKGDDGFDGESNVKEDADDGKEGLRDGSVDKSDNDSGAAASTGNDLNHTVAQLGAGRGAGGRRGSNAPLNLTIKGNIKDVLAALTAATLHPELVQHSAEQTSANLNGDATHRTALGGAHHHSSSASAVPVGYDELIQQSSLNRTSAGSPLMSVASPREQSLSTNYGSPHSFHSTSGGMGSARYHHHHSMHHLHHQQQQQLATDRSLVSFSSPTSGGTVVQSPHSGPGSPSGGGTSSHFDRAMMMGSHHHHQSKSSPHSSPRGAGLNGTVSKLASTTNHLLSARGMRGASIGGGGGAIPGTPHASPRSVKSASPIDHSRHYTRHVSPSAAAASSSHSPRERDRLRMAHFNNTNGGGSSNNLPLLQGSSTSNSPKLTGASSSAAMASPASGAGSPSAKPVTAAAAVGAGAASTCPLPTSPQHGCMQPHLLTNHSITNAAADGTVANNDHQLRSGPSSPNGRQDDLFPSASTNNSFNHNSTGWAAPQQHSGGMSTAQDRAIAEAIGSLPPMGGGASAGRSGVTAAQPATAEGDDDSAEIANNFTGVSLGIGAGSNMLMMQHLLTQHQHGGSNNNLAGSMSLLVSGNVTPSTCTGGGGGAATASEQQQQQQPRPTKSFVGNRMRGYSTGMTPLHLPSNAGGVGSSLGNRSRGMSNVSATPPLQASGSSMLSPPTTVTMVGGGGVGDHHHYHTGIASRVSSAADLCDDRGESASMRATSGGNFNSQAASRSTSALPSAAAAPPTTMTATMGRTTSTLGGGARDTISFPFDGTATSNGGGGSGMLHHASSSLRGSSHNNGLKGSMTMGGTLRSDGSLLLSSSGHAASIAASAFAAAAVASANVTASVQQQPPIPGASTSSTTPHFTLNLSATRNLVDNGMYGMDTCRVPATTANAPNGGQHQQESVNAPVGYNLRSSSADDGLKQMDSGVLPDGTAGAEEEDLNANLPFGPKAKAIAGGRFAEQDMQDGVVLTVHIKPPPLPIYLPDEPVETEEEKQLIAAFERLSEERLNERYTIASGEGHTSANSFEGAKYSDDELRAVRKRLVELRSRRKLRRQRANPTNTYFKQGSELMTPEQCERITMSIQASTQIIRHYGGRVYCTEANKLVAVFSILNQMTGDAELSEAAINGISECNRAVGAALAIRDELDFNASVWYANVYDGDTVVGREVVTEEQALWELEEDSVFQHFYYTYGIGIDQSTLISTCVYEPIAAPPNAAATDDDGYVGTTYKEFNSLSGTAMETSNDLAHLNFHLQTRILISEVIQDEVQSTIVSLLVDVICAARTRMGKPHDPNSDCDSSDATDEEEEFWFQQQQLLADNESFTGATTVGGDSFSGRSGSMTSPTVNGPPPSSRRRLSTTARGLLGSSSRMQQRRRSTTIAMGSGSFGGALSGSSKYPELSRIVPAIHRIAKIGVFELRGEKEELENRRAYQREVLYREKVERIQRHDEMRFYGEEPMSDTTDEEAENDVDGVVGFLVPEHVLVHYLEALYLFRTGEFKLASKCLSEKIPSRYIQGDVQIQRLGRLMTFYSAHPELARQKQVSHYFRIRYDDPWENVDEWYAGWRLRQHDRNEERELKRILKPFQSEATVMRKMRRKRGGGGGQQRYASVSMGSISAASSSNDPIASNRRQLSAPVVVVGNNASPIVNGIEPTNPNPTTATTSAGQSSALLGVSRQESAAAIAGDGPAGGVPTANEQLNVELLSTPATGAAAEPSPAAEKSTVISAGEFTATNTPSASTAGAAVTGLVPLAAAGGGGSAASAEVAQQLNSTAASGLSSEEKNSHADAAPPTATCSAITTPSTRPDGGNITTAENSNTLGPIAAASASAPPKSSDPSLSGTMVGDNGTAIASVSTATAGTASASVTTACASAGTRPTPFSLPLSGLANRRQSNGHHPIANNENDSVTTTTDAAAGASSSDTPVNGGDATVVLSSTTMTSIGFVSPRTARTATTTPRLFTASYTTNNANADTANPHSVIDVDASGLANDASTITQQSSRDAEQCPPPPLSARGDSSDNSNSKLSNAKRLSELLKMKDSTMDVFGCVSVNSNMGGGGAFNHPPPSPSRALSTNAALSSLANNCGTNVSGSFDPAELSALGNATLLAVATAQLVGGTASSTSSTTNAMLLNANSYDALDDMMGAACRPTAAPPQAILSMRRASDNTSNEANAKEESPAAVRPNGTVTVNVVTSADGADEEHQPHAATATTVSGGDDIPEQVLTDSTTVSNLGGGRSSTAENTMLPIGTTGGIAALFARNKYVGGGENSGNGRSPTPLALSREASILPEALGAADAFSNMLQRHMQQQQQQQLHNANNSLNVTPESATPIDGGIIPPLPTSVPAAGTSSHPPSVTSPASPPSASSLLKLGLKMDPNALSVKDHNLNSTVGGGGNEGAEEGGDEEEDAASPDAQSPNYHYNGRNGVPVAGYRHLRQETDLSMALNGAKPINEESGSGAASPAATKANGASAKDPTSAHSESVLNATNNAGFGTGGAASPAAVGGGDAADPEAYDPHNATTFGMNFKALLGPDGAATNDSATHNAPSPSVIRRDGNNDAAEGSSAITNRTTSDGFASYEPSFDPPAENIGRATAGPRELAEQLQSSGDLSRFGFVDVSQRRDFSPLSPTGDHHDLHTVAVGGGRSFEGADAVATTTTTTTPTHNNIGVSVCEINSSAGSHGVSPQELVDSGLMASELLSDAAKEAHSNSASEPPTAAPAATAAAANTNTANDDIGSPSPARQYPQRGGGGGRSGGKGGFALSASPTTTSGVFNGASFGNHHSVSLATSDSGMGSQYLLEEEWNRAPASSVSVGRTPHANNNNNANGVHASQSIRALSQQNNTNTNNGAAAANGHTPSNVLDGAMSVGRGVSEARGGAGSGAGAGGGGAAGKAAVAAAAAQRKGRQYHQQGMATSMSIHHANPGNGGGLLSDIKNLEDALRASSMQNAMVGPSGGTFSPAAIPIAAGNSNASPTPIAGSSAANLMNPPETPTAIANGGSGLAFGQTPTRSNFGTSSPSQGGLVAYGGVGGNGNSCEPTGASTPSHQDGGYCLPSPRLRSNNNSHVHPMPGTPLMSFAGSGDVGPSFATAAASVPGSTPAPAMSPTPSHHNQQQHNTNGGGGGIYINPPDLWKDEGFIDYKDVTRVDWRRSEKVLGEGAFGQVYLGMRPSDGKLVAIKTLRIPKIPVVDPNAAKEGEGGEDEMKGMTMQERTAARRRAMMAKMKGGAAAAAPKRDPAAEQSRVLAQLIAEVKVYSETSHVNIVQFAGCAIVGSRLLVNMEFVSGGSLQTIISSFGALPIPAVQRYLKHILRGLNYLHTHPKGSIIHCDVKPGNVLLTVEGNCKVTDFGTAINMSKLDGTNSATAIGTPLYMSPEHAMAKPTTKSDVYSVGLMTYELLTGKLPFSLPDSIAIHRHLHQLRSNEAYVPDIKQSDLPSEAAYRFVMRCIDRNPSKRPTCEQLLHDPFLFAFSGGGDNANGGGSAALNGGTSMNLARSMSTAFNNANSNNAGGGGASTPFHGPSSSSIASGGGANGANSNVSQSHFGNLLTADGAPTSSFRTKQRGPSLMSPSVNSGGMRRERTSSNFEDAVGGGGGGGSSLVATGSNVFSVNGSFVMRPAVPAISGLNLNAFASPLGDDYAGGGGGGFGGLTPRTRLQRSPSTPGLPMITDVNNAANANGATSSSAPAASVPGTAATTSVNSNNGSQPQITKLFSVYPNNSTSSANSRGTNTNNVHQNPSVVSPTSIISEDCRIAFSSGNAAVMAAGVSVSSSIRGKFGGFDSAGDKDTDEDDSTVKRSDLLFASQASRRVSALSDVLSPQVRQSAAAMGSPAIIGSGHHHSDDPRPLGVMDESIASSAGAAAARNAGQYAYATPSRQLLDSTSGVDDESVASVVGVGAATILVDSITDGANNISREDTAHSFFQEEQHAAQMSSSAAMAQTARGYTNPVVAASSGAPTPVMGGRSAAFGGLATACPTPVAGVAPPPADDDGRDDAHSSCETITVHSTTVLATAADAVVGNSSRRLFGHERGATASASAGGGDSSVATDGFLMSGSASFFSPKSVLLASDGGGGAGLGDGGDGVDAPPQLVVIRKVGCADDDDATPMRPAASASTTMPEDPASPSFPAQLLLHRADTAKPNEMMLQRKMMRQQHQAGGGVSSTAPPSVVVSSPVTAEKEREVEAAAATDSPHVRRIVVLSRGDDGPCPPQQTPQGDIAGHQSPPAASTAVCVDPVTVTAPAAEGTEAATTPLAYPLITVSVVSTPSPATTPRPSSQPDGAMVLPSAAQSITGGGLSANRPPPLLGFLSTDPKVYRGGGGGSSSYALSPNTLTAGNSSNRGGDGTANSGYASKTLSILSGVSANSTDDEGDVGASRRVSMLDDGARPFQPINNDEQRAANNDTGDK